MKTRLQNKQRHQYGWLLAWLLATARVVAGTPFAVDTCRHPEPPVITGSAKAVCRNETVTLAATGCAGTVVWSNGQMGNAIVVQPQQATKYTAICRLQPGCISCFAEVWTVTVNTPDAPVVTPSAALICPDETVTLTATNCVGTVRWPDQSTGLTWTGRPQQSTTYQAVCEQNHCVSSASKPVTVQVERPAVPIVSADRLEICPGQTVQLTASGCLGNVRWTDRGQGLTRTVAPDQTTTYRAVCHIGSCRSDSTLTVTVTVRPSAQMLHAETKLTNGCPFQTADLSKAIRSRTDTGLSYAFRTGPSWNAPSVQSPGAVVAGTYYLFGRTAEGCYTAPVALTVSIKSCPNAIPPCLSNPAAVAIRLDTLDWVKGVVRLQGRLSGSAEWAEWKSNGGGLFAEAGLSARYLLSETDRQRGSATFTLTSPDPDGSGPCVGASAQMTVNAPPQPQPISIVGEPLKLPEGGALSGATEDGTSIFIPEGFSPNGDGINDYFVIRRLSTGTTAQLEVYNRWGHLVYENRDYKNDWDGTANQGINATDAKAELPDGTYYYQIRLSDGREFTRFLTLSR